MSERLWLEEDLVRKYDQPGPRYTSYPTAPNFVPSFGAEDLARELERPATAGLSLYVHVPFCEKLCYFCGCNKVIRHDHRSNSDEYLDWLERELDLARVHVDGKRVVDQAHLGGGTPTFLPPDAMDRLLGALERRFPFARDAERGVEVHPNETRRGHFEVLAAHGWNRLSVGIQDFDPLVQETINRIQPLELTRRTIEDARSLGFTSVNVDLIYGLPHQTVERFSRTIDAVMTLSPDRIAVYNFAYLPQVFKHQRVMPEEALPSPGEKLAILAETVRRLGEAGYVFIGYDHFAKPSDELAVAQTEGTLNRNFMGYTTRKGLDLLAFGVSAISQVGRCYAQNKKSIPEWRDALKQGGLPVERGLLLTDDDLLRRDVIMELTCQFALEKREIEARHGIVFDDVFGEALAALRPLEADGLVALEPERVRVLPRGRFFVRNVCMAFDAWLKRGTGTFSRTV